MMNQFKIIVTLLAANLLGSGVAAEISLVEEFSFEIPAAVGNYDCVLFNDVDHDDVPEALVSDGHLVRCYRTGEVDPWLEFALGSIVDSQDFINYRIEFADVTRDSTPDIVIAYFWSDYDFGDLNCEGYWRSRTVLYDGSSGFQLAGEYAECNGGPMMCFHSPHGISALRAFDFNHDGYNELLLGHEKHGPGHPTESTVGQTDLFLSFPDSLAWSSSMLLEGPEVVATGDFGTIASAERFRYWGWDFPGSDGCDASNCRVWFNDQGEEVSAVLCLSEPAAATQQQSGCIADSWIRTECRLLCAGPILPEVDAQIVLTHQVWEPGSTCSECDCSVGEYDYFKVVSRDSLELVLRVPDPAVFDKYTCLPEQPGDFFATTSDSTIVQIRGSDGAVVQSSASAGSGELSWVRPYGDHRVRLLAQDGRSYVFYSYDIPTSVDVVSNQPSVPSSFELGQPFPNPFNSTLTIPLTMHRKSNVRVQVYNLLGRELATLHDGPAELGQRVFTWDAHMAASGVYFVRAATEHESATVKAVLLK